MNTGGARQLCYIYTIRVISFRLQYITADYEFDRKSQLLPTGYKTLEGNKTDYI